MNDFYIHSIQIANQRNIPECTIDLSADTKRHLIITGPNGSGKTTFFNYLTESLERNSSWLSAVLTRIRKLGIETNENVISYFNSMDESEKAYYSHYFNSLTDNYDNDSVRADVILKPAFQIARNNHDFLIYRSEARRDSSFVMPEGTKNLAEKSTGDKFVQLLVNLRIRKAVLFEEISTSHDAHKKHELEVEYHRIEEWFKDFENALADLLGTRNFSLDYDKVGFNYTIHEENKEPYNFSQLSDGYSAILKIVTDLMLAMSTDPISGYDMPGIAVIDEIETHLHIELQRKVLPFLTKFFPNIQFIVTTHSPFVLSSVSDAVIFDMKTRRRYEDFSAYSYESIIEGYYGESQYSILALYEFQEVREILKKDELSAEDRKLILEFDNKIKSGVSRELKDAWLTLKLDNSEKING